MVKGSCTHLVTNAAKGGKDEVWFHQYGGYETIPVTIILLLERLAVAEVRAP